MLVLLNSVSAGDSPGFLKARMVTNLPRGGGVIIGARNDSSILIFSDGKGGSHRVLFSRSCKD